MIKAIIQEDIMGCGVACVAFALNISYKKAKQKFKYPKNATYPGFFIKEIIYALSKGGKNYSFEKISKKSKS